MPAGPAHLANLSDADRQILEGWLVDFDQAWHEDRLAIRVSELPPPGNALRMPALVEMVKIDLERQWQRGRRLALEDYLRSYPELGTPATVSVDLLHAEYEARRHAGAAAEFAEFAERFPHQAEELRRRVAQADNTLPRPSPPLPVLGADTLPEQFGRYRILRKLGHGGMGSVYLAHDTQLERKVALKVPRFAPEEGPSIRERFAREAKALAALHHPNLCPVYDAGVIQDIPYLTMAYLDGQPLADLLHEGQPWPQQKAAVLIRQLALALAEAHAHGVVHRDLKPANVMMTRRGEPVVMDFGLARRLQQEDVRLTTPGTILGTPAYMAPEQITGDTETSGPACDIYTLGVLLYELLTGRLPFQGFLADLVVQVQIHEPTPPSVHRPDIAPELDALCLKALAKKPSQRPRSMTEVAEALAHYLDITSPLTVRRSRRRLRRWGWLAVPLVVGGLAVLGVTLTRSPPAPETAPRQSALVQPTEPVVETPFHELQRFEGHTAEVQGVAFSDNGRQVVSFAADKTVRSWDLESGQEREEARLKLSELTQGKALSTDGRRLLGQLFQSVVLWDIPARKELRPAIKIHSPQEATVAFSRSGGHFLAGGTSLVPLGEEQVRGWDVETGKQVANLRGHTAPIRAVALSPNGERALSAGKDGVRLWDVAASKELRHLERDTVTTLVFSPDGRLFLTGDLVGVVLVWDAETGEERHRLAGHTGAVAAVVVATDGRFAASCADDRTVRLWDIEQGKQMVSLEGHTAGVTAVAFAPDGRRIVSGSKDRALRLWGR